MVNPADSIKKFGVPKGAVVADFGVGAGYYAYELSHAVGDEGKVFAVDIQKSLIEAIKKQSLEKGIKNIEIIWGDIEVVGGTKLRRASMDLIVVSNVLSQVDAKAGLVQECARVIKDKGRILLIDWSESFGSLGPISSMIVDKQTARRIFEDGPFEYKNDIDVGEHHYGMVFEKKAS